MSAAAVIGEQVAQRKAAPIHDISDPADVGVLPNDWDVKPVGDLAAVSAGGTPNRGVATYWDGDIPWITTAQIDFATIAESDQFISLEGLRHSAARLLQPGAILLALYGQGKTRGKVAILGIEAATNQACAAIEFHRGNCVEFFFYQLASRYEEIRRYSNTGNQDNLNGALARSIPLVVPEPHEQRAIAAALSDVDTLIGALDKLIAKKRGIMQASIQQLLTGRTRLKRFAKYGHYKNTDVGKIPSSWDVVSLGEVFQFKNGLNKAKRYFGYGTPSPVAPTNSSDISASVMLVSKTSWPSCW
jgi:type I restriction enzyme S subunit